MQAGEMENLTPAERERVRAAVQAAEQGTVGEIVAMVVSRSGRYADASYRGAGIVGLLTLTLLVTVEFEWAPWDWRGTYAAWLVLLTVLGALLGFWIGSLPPIVRLLTPTDKMIAKVRRRAQWAFLHHRLENTRGRTAILILVSLLEHRVQVLADRGIHRHVPNGTWDQVVATILEGIRRGDLTDGLCRAIEQCGVLLSRYCPATTGDNPNELPDDLITHD